MNDIIRIENLHHTYLGTPPVDALRGIHLTIGAGEYVAIVGANGSGKSTLARHLNALLLPTRGDVWIDGTTTRNAESVHAIRAAVQMVFQHPDAQLVATIVEEDVAFGPENFGVPETQLPERVTTSLQTVGMWAHRQKAPHLLSAGQKQRVAIAGAIAVQPRVLVLDEATAMLDPAGRNAVLDILRQLHAQGTTIVTITHEMDEAAQAERVVVMSAGRIAMDDTPRRVFARADDLRALSLDIPIVAELAHRLGLTMCLTPAEFIAALTKRGQRTQAIALPDTGDDHHDAIIRVENLSHWYLRGLPLESRALENVDFSVSRGATMGLIGPTGSGKSTLIQHLNALLLPQAGRVIIGEHHLADASADVRAVRRMVGLIFQQPEDQLFEQFVGDDVAFGPRQFGLSKDQVRERVRWAMESVGLGFDAFKDRLTNTLSGGERRRAALAGVLAMRPHVLVADEPTAGLDPRARAEVIEIFQRLHTGGTTLVIASHRLDDIAALCQQVTALDDGRLMVAGSVRQVFSRADFLQAYGLAVPVVAHIAQMLCAQGWQIPNGILFVDELVGAVS